MTTENKLKYGTYSALTVTNLQSLAADSSDPYAGWQSDRVDNTSALALDYEYRIHLTTANTSPAGAAAAFVYIVPWIYNGSGWDVAGNFGTTTAPTGSEGTASMSEPNNMILAARIAYKIAQQPLECMFSLGAVCGFIPDGHQIVIRNETGAALSTGCVVANRPITSTNA